jgi:hypothetical protein
VLFIGPLLDPFEEIIWHASLNLGIALWLAHLSALCYAVYTEANQLDSPHVRKVRFSRERTVNLT